LRSWQTPVSHTQILKWLQPATLPAAGSFNPDSKEKFMKKLTVLALVLTSLSALSGCVAYPVPYDNGRPDHPPGASRGNGDRDGDGVRNRDDRRPNNPYRY
jgi:hypothetical protein